MKVIDLTNKRFGKLKVLSRTYIENYNRAAWKCLCDCGKEIIIKGVYLRNGDTKSCGCWNIEQTVIRNKTILPKHITLPNNEALLNEKLKIYKNGAKIRNLSWELSAEEAFYFFRDNCYYCGIEPDKEKLNGIDRLNSSLGYFYSNTVSCCTFCNYAKRENSLEYFNIKVQQLSNKLQKNKNELHKVYLESEEYREFYFQKLEDSY